MSYWIDTCGTLIPLAPRSVLVGRSSDCDIVIDDPRVSRHHMLFRLTEGGAEVVPCSGQPVVVNGVPRTEPTALGPGDGIELGDRAFNILLRDAPPAVDSAVLWAIERSPGMLFRVAQSPFSVGGAPGDHLVVPSWPPSVLVLHRVSSAITLEALLPGVWRGTELVPGECVPLAPGAWFEYGGTKLRVIVLPRGPGAVTESSRVEELPTGVELRFLPRGARLTLHLGGRTLAVYLPDRRSDLVATLLQPPPPFAPGDAIPNELLLERVWTQGSLSTNEDLNTLIFRTRKNLISADMDGAMLIDRQGGAVRFRLAAGATVVVSTA